MFIDQIDYFQWWLVGFYVLLVGGFVYGLLRPHTQSEWRSMGMSQAFVVALYAEMYGMPLSLYGVAWATGQSEYVTDHFHGHAWPYLLGLGDWGAIIFDVVGQAMVALGALITLWGWRDLYQGRGGVARGGLYRYIRHPQYLGFILFLTGSIVNWPTLITLLMYPFLVIIYRRLAKTEEAAMLRTQREYASYIKETGFFVPKFRRNRSA